MGDNTNEYVKTKLITGEHLFVSRKLVVGYCHFSGHKGSVTKTLLKSHECVKKGCHYFEKNKDNPYWEAIEQEKAKKQRKRETVKRIRNEEENRLKAWIESAQRIANDLGYDIKVVSVKKVPQKKNYILFYVSRYSQNDWFRYFELAKTLGKELGGKVELKHIIDIDGYYATF